MAIVGAAANIEHELANGYNSGDEYTGRTGNNLTLAEWQEVRPIKCDTVERRLSEPHQCYLSHHFFETVYRLIV